MALLFNNSDTKAENTTATGLKNSIHTIVMWFKANSIGAGSNARIITLGGGSEDYSLRWNGTQISLVRQFTTTSGIWSSNPGPSHDGTTWIGFAVTYDGTATTNNAQMWARRLGLDAGVVAVTTDRDRGPVGTVASTHNGYDVGNDFFGGQTFDGSIAYVQVFPGLILTQAQIDAALNNPGSVAGCALYLPLTSDGTDSSGNGYNATITGTTPTFVSGPPGIPTGGAASAPPLSRSLAGGFGGFSGGM